MANATPSPATYQLCSYRVGTGEQTYTVYELRQNLTQEEYTYELLAFCLQTQNRSLEEIPACLERIRVEGFSEWAYDDRIYQSPCVQDVTEQEYLRGQAENGQASCDILPPPCSTIRPTLSPS